MIELTKEEYAELQAVVNAHDEFFVEQARAWKRRHPGASYEEYDRKFAVPYYKVAGTGRLMFSREFWLTL
jgi:hypothetical protein